MAKRKTIGDNPLDSVIPAGEPGKAPEEAVKVKRTRYSFQLPDPLLEQIRDAVYFKREITMSEFAEKALIQALEKAKQKWNNGKSFLRRPSALRPGKKLLL